MSRDYAATMSFAVFQWVTEEIIQAKGDGLAAFFAEDFAAHVRSKGGTDPHMTDYVEASAEQMMTMGVEPRAGQRLYRIYGYAVPPAGTVPVEYDIAE